MLMNPWGDPNHNHHTSAIHIKRTHSRKRRPKWCQWRTVCIPAWSHTHGSVFNNYLPRHGIDLRSLIQHMLMIRLLQLSLTLLYFSLSWPSGCFAHTESRLRTSIGSRICSIKVAEWLLGNLSPCTKTLVSNLCNVRLRITLYLPRWPSETSFLPVAYRSTSHKPQSRTFHTSW